MTDPMKLAYEERGSGPVLLMIHGFPFDRRQWFPQVAGLADIRTCVAVDLRGHGLSLDEEPRDYSMDLFADDIAATLEDIGVDQADIAGLSMGGYVAFALWRRHRARVRSLILSDTKPEADSDEAKAGRDAAAKAILDEGMAKFHAGLGPKLMGDDPSADAVERIEQMFVDTDPGVAAAVAIAMRDRQDSTSDLGTIDVPTLWLHGEQDKLMPIDDARARAEAVAGARFIAIPGAGHVPTLENPDAVSTAMREFLTT